MIPSGALTTFTADAWDPQSNDISEYVEWSNNLGEFGIGSPVQAYLPDGAHTIYATVDDGLGNTAEDSIQVLVGDNAVPEVTIVSPVNYEVGDTGTTVLLDATATDADGNTTFEWEWSSDFDGVVSTNANGSVLLSEGIHRLTAAANDPFGAMGSAEVWVIVHGTSGNPLVRILEPADGGSYTTQDEVLFTAIAHDAADGDLSAFVQWRFNGQYVGQGASFATQPYEGDPTTVTAKIEDFNEQQATDSTYITVVYAEPPPVVTITSPTDGQVVYLGADVEFVASAVNDDGFPISSTWTWTSDIDGQIGTGESFWNYGTLTEGVHTITATVDNPAGPPSEAGSASISLNVTVNNPPSVSITTPIDSDTFHVGESILFFGNASDTEEGDLSGSIVWVSDLDGIFGTGASVNFAGLQEGSHQIAAEITDGGGLSDVAYITIQVVNDAPVPSISSPADGSSAVAGESVSFAGTATDTEDGDLSASIQWVSDLDGLLFTGAGFSTSTLSVGSHQISAEVTDSGGAFALDAITLTINANQDPTVSISAPSNGTSVIETDPVTFAGAASDPEDGDLTAGISWSSNLDGTIGSGAGFTTAALSVGNHTITASVTDAYGATDNAVITVNVAANTAPMVAITSPPNGSEANAGDSVTFTGSATDNEDGDLTAALAWSSDLDGALGTGGSFASSGLSVGTHTITATVGDSHGLAAQAQVLLTVNSAPVQVTFTSIAAEDGWVLESNENSSVGNKIASSSTGTSALRAGDDRKDKQYRTILSFDTSSIPASAQIQSVTLRLRRGNLTGQNPHNTHGACKVDIATGGFSGSTALQSSDFEAAADAVGVTDLSNPTSNLDWSEGNLNAAGLAAVNTAGTTQFRVYFEIGDEDDRRNDYLGFYAGEEGGSSRPELVVTYQE